MFISWPWKVPGELKEKKSCRQFDTSVNDGIIRYSEVTNPALEIFLPDPSLKNGSAVIVCPGGGYHILAYDLEGTEIAAWLNRLGIAAFVLQYRIPDNKEGALQDVQRAIRVVRDNSQKWNIDSDKIGVMGFSAGGSLSARASILLIKRLIRLLINQTVFPAGLHSPCLFIMLTSIRVQTSH